MSGLYDHFLIQPEGSKFNAIFLPKGVKIQRQLTLGAEELSKRVEDQIQTILTNLDQSVSAARSALENVSKKNTFKTIIIVTLLLLLSLSIGFGLGIFYNERRSYSLAMEFLKPVNGEKSVKKYAPR